MGLAKLAKCMQRLLRSLCTEHGATYQLTRDEPSWGMGGGAGGGWRRDVGRDVAMKG